MITIVKTFRSKATLSLYTHHTIPSSRKLRKLSLVKMT